MHVLVSTFALAGAFMCLSVWHANAQQTTDIDAMETCLEESVMVSQPDHCTGLISDACVAKGGGTADCLDREEAVWDAILREHWPLRCASCPDGFSLFRNIRAEHALQNPACKATDLAAKRCLMVETARQARFVFGRSR